MKKLAFDLTFHDLYTREGIERIQQIFIRYLKDTDETLGQIYTHYVKQPQGITDKAYSDLILHVSPIVEEFICALFGKEKLSKVLQQTYLNASLIEHIRRTFVQRMALKNFPTLESLSDFDETQTPFQGINTDYEYAITLQKWLEEPELYCNELGAAQKFAAYQVLTNEAQATSTTAITGQLSPLFWRPQKVFYENLLPYISVDKSPYFSNTLRSRNGFSLTDEGNGQSYALAHANYCIQCHHQGKDSCSKGLLAKQEAGFQKTSLGVDLSGCPLEQKISEMNELISKGYSIAALATIMIDNPMLPATGHRICNECSKACIYQKQTPIDIPSIETQVLTDVLDLAYGFEIYSLLCKWNPLDIKRPTAKPSTGKKVLVVGMGPAGFTLAHHLLNDGHCVVGVDGLKIEPLSSHHKEIRPIINWKSLHEPLDARIPAGFGGVMEYGITSRYNKNFLKVIRLVLERRNHFLLQGSFRFGGTITIDEALKEFDHVALCTGAANPAHLDIENGTAGGIRSASDFLMSLQLNGAHRSWMAKNLQLRLPVIVVGGGLTAIDTATEALAYYPIQVKNFKNRYDILKQHIGEDALRKNWSALDHEIADEFLAHATLFEQCDLQEPTSVQRCVQSLGGVTIAYRKDLNNAPAYKLNHEEIAKALEEGIFIEDNFAPVSAQVDQQGWITGLTAQDGTFKACKQVLVAIGVKPNTNIRYDEPVALEKDYFIPCDRSGNPQQWTSLKEGDPHFFLYRPENTSQQGRLSFFGDVHPTYKGNVVKAMASAKHGYPLISSILIQQDNDLCNKHLSTNAFLDHFKTSCTATVDTIKTLFPSCHEITIHAPRAAQQFQCGHLYKLENYETSAKSINISTQKELHFAMEGIALNAVEVDKEKGLLQFLVYEAGGSSMMMNNLKEGDNVLLMGPTGSPFKFPAPGSHILLIATHLHSAVFWPLGKALIKHGCHVTCIATFKRPRERFRPHKLYQAAHTILWCYEEAIMNDVDQEELQDHRPQDLYFFGSIEKALQHYKEELQLHTVNHVTAHGSNGLNITIANALKDEWKNLFNEDTPIKGAVNAPMQCMMKGICAQCVQVHHDEVTNTSTLYYTCQDSHKNIKTADFTYLDHRMKNNSVLEKIAKLWVLFNQGRLKPQ